MNMIESFINRVSADGRITDGIFNSENEEHQNVFQEHLEQLGATVEESIAARNKLTEGKHPERQAYNANGILVTFPTPEYKQRALQRGTHFEKNPKQKDPNVTFDDASPASPSTPQEPKPEDKPQPPAPTEKPEKATTPTPAAPTEPPKPTTPPPQIGVPVLVLPPGELKKREDAIVHKAQEEYVEKILSTESVTKKFTLTEARRLNFYNKGMNWYNSDGDYVGISCYNPETLECFILG